MLLEFTLEHGLIGRQHLSKPLNRTTSHTRVPFLKPYELPMAAVLRGGAGDGNLSTTRLSPSRGKVSDFRIAECGRAPLRV